MGNPTINGIELKTVADSHATEEELIGDAARRAFSGNLLSSVRARKGAWPIETVPYEYEESEILKSLLTGAGHVWDFEDDGPGDAWQYSSRGGPAADMIQDCERSTAEAKFGGASLLITAETHGVMWQLSSDTLTPYTALWWEYDGSEWHHCANATSASASGFFRDGEDTGYGSFDAMVYQNAIGYLKVEAITAGVHVDDVAFLPYSLLDHPELIVALKDFGEAFSPLPRLKLGGGLVGDEQRLVRSTEPISLAHKGLAAADGAWHPNMRRISATLQEV